jgi:hypothetical protein
VENTLNDTTAGLSSDGKSSKFQFVETDRAGCTTRDAGGARTERNLDQMTTG